MIEPEMCFINLKDLIDISEDYLKYCLKMCFESCRDELEFMDKQYCPSLVQRLEEILSKPFYEMSYTQVIDILRKEIDEKKGCC